MVTVMLPAGQEELLPPVKAPGSKELGIRSFTLEEATTGQAIVRLTRDFVAAVEEGWFKPGVLAI